MSKFKLLNRNLKSDEATGFGTYSKDNSGRYYKKNGQPNVRKTGIGWFESLSWYHTMISLPTKYFLLLIFVVYTVINLIFTAFYYIIGIDQFSGVIEGEPFENFMELFFFSTQTFTTVGYGRISPSGMISGSLATLEAFMGLLSFAIATGLFYGRFSKPEAYIKFSNNILITPFQNGKALMFRLAPYKNNNLTGAEIKLTLAIKDEENGVWKNKFYPLAMQLNKINALTLSWTVVHPINEKSPFFQLSDTEIIHTPWELLVFLQGFDEAYSNNVISHTSYLNTETIANAKFDLMHSQDAKNMTTILDLSLLNSYSKL